jgi:hypothetical protein
MPAEDSVYCVHDAIRELCGLCTWEAKGTGPWLSPHNGYEGPQ